MVAEAENGERRQRLFGELNRTCWSWTFRCQHRGLGVPWSGCLPGTPRRGSLSCRPTTTILFRCGALRFGAKGYLCKRAAPEEFLRAVGAVKSDQRYIDPGGARRSPRPAFGLGESGGGADDEKSWRFFSNQPREKRSMKSPSDFCLSPSTVGTHLYHIKQKLNVPERCGTRARRDAMG